MNIFNYNISHTIERYLKYKSDRGVTCIIDIPIILEYTLPICGLFRSIIEDVEIVPIEEKYSRIILNTHIKKLGLALQYLDMIPSPSIINPALELIEKDVKWYFSCPQPMRILYDRSIYNLYKKLFEGRLLKSYMPKWMRGLTACKINSVAKIIDYGVTSENIAEEANQRNINPIISIEDYRNHKEGTIILVENRNTPIIGDISIGNAKCSDTCLLGHI